MDCGCSPPSINRVSSIFPEKLLIEEIQPFINEYKIENDVPAMTFVKTVHYDKVAAKK